MATTSIFIKEETTLKRTGNSLCLIISPHWIKLNNLERLHFAVEVTTENDKITIVPIKSRYQAKQTRLEEKMVR